MTDSEPFTLISEFASQSFYSEYEALRSAKVADQDVPLTGALRSHYPELTLTVVPARNCPLLGFAALGLATAELDTATENVLRWRGYVPGAHRGDRGQLGEAVFFAKYHYKWGVEDFIVYTVSTGYQTLQYILKEPGDGEDVRSHCRTTDSLIVKVVTTMLGDESKYIYVFDEYYWIKSTELWEEVQHASWEKVILDEKMKEELTGVAKNFFDGREVYKKYGVPWKRGLIFHGPPGNGKTISLKALMHTLYDRKDSPVPTLYVKSAPTTNAIAAVFAHARRMSPCLLVMEDIETIVTSKTRSYFFNEVDGLAGNDGILMVASTNYLERLDPGLSKRPSRFDRKYLFPLPNKAERSLYAAYWRNNLAKTNPAIDFPEKICSEFAKLTQDFSFAYMQEAFIATLLALSREEANSVVRGTRGDGDLADNKLWRYLKTQIAILREDMGSGSDEFAAEAEEEESFVPTQFGQGRRELVGADGRHQPNHSAGMPPYFVSFDVNSVGGLEAGTETMAAYGINKNRRFAETAFEYGL